MEGVNGQFSDKFKIPYKEEEERAIIDFFLANSRYKERRGREVWKAMEEAEVCAVWVELGVQCALGGLSSFRGISWVRSV